MAVKGPNQIMNAFEALRSNPIARRFEIRDMVFAQFNCPEQAEPLGLWAQTDHFIHVLAGKSSWKMTNESCSAETGQTVFFKKGVYIMPEHFGEDICVQVYFIPDASVREAVMEVAADLPAVSETVDACEQAIRVKTMLACQRFSRPCQSILRKVKSRRKPCSS